MSSPPPQPSSLQCPTSDAEGLGHNSGRVRGHRVPNPRWRAPSVGSLRRHPRYRALPPVETVLGGVHVGAEDDAVLPFLRQHTPAWEAARVGRITTGSLSTCLGLWSSEGTIGQLGAPKSGYKTREMQAAELDQVTARTEHGRGRGRREEGPDDDDDDDGGDDDDDEARLTRLGETRDCCVRVVDTYNTSFGPNPPEDFTDETEGGWAVTIDEAVAAAASGERKVAAALGREQESAALYALLQVRPRGEGGGGCGTTYMT